MIQLQQRSDEFLSWRPNVLVFGGPPEERPHLLRLAHWLVGDRGLSTYFQLVPKQELPATSFDKKQAELELYRAVTRHCPQMLARNAAVDSLYAGIRDATLHYGLAGMMPNTVLMGFGEDSPDPQGFTELVRDLHKMDHNLLFLAHDKERGFGARRHIDVWWGGLERNGALMLLLVYYLRTSGGWGQTKVRVNVVVSDVKEKIKAEKRLNDLLRQARIRAVPNVMLREGDRGNVAGLIAEVSRDADLTVLGLRPPSDDDTGEFMDRTKQLVGGLGTTLLVRASSAFDGEQLLFEGGEKS
jgi:hypothetical protein